MLSVRLYASFICITCVNTMNFCIHKRALASLLAGLLIAGGAQAQTNKPDTTSLQAVQNTLQSRFPKVKISKVQPSQWPWLYEVLTDDEMFYVDTTGNYLFYGKIIDTRTQKDLTEARWTDLTRTDFNSLPLNLALKQVKGDGSRKLVVFADPHCPYCVRFEKTLQDVTNVTVYTFLYPLETIHPGATERSKKIWCAADRQGTWAAWMTNKVEPASNGSCDTSALNTLLALGDKLKVTGTPTLIFEDGHRVPGAVDKARLEEEFKSAASGK
jgi:thiol:disulfide interchange protein DsbC